MKPTCPICPRGCSPEENQTGFCRARANINGAITCLNYGRITSVTLDPIEKKPLRRFFPNSMILSAGSFGCNFRCGFCQNHGISMSGAESRTAYVPPEELVEKAAGLIPEGNIGIAYTYNEPLVGYEYVYDCAKLARERGLKNVLVTNGYITEQPLSELLPFIDAANIDVKGFTAEFYGKIQGDLESVKRTVELSYGKCHIEITALIIPGENDAPDEILALSEWISKLDKNIPLHLSRYFPRHNYSAEPASVAKLRELREIAKKNLDYVYLGNV
ncbi:MAG: AmmeMemoRadiSam system radical SAM enzyme [Oscillospiraceae bacterium]|jgi:pyruvate formate lyase activating enzyme|nr:AmmeMemoRadiSam system radical SAM enzyme [Oscillospiraceae bacterium]